MKEDAAAVEKHGDEIKARYSKTVQGVRDSAMRNEPILTDATFSRARPR